jgi:hypothetical protein
MKTVNEIQDFTKNINCKKLLLPMFPLLVRGLGGGREV